MKKNAQQPIGTTSTSLQDNVKKVEEVADNMKKQVESLHNKEQADAEKKKQEAAQEIAKAPPTAPAAPGAPQAPGTMAADDQSAEDIMNDIKKNIGKLWAIISDSKEDSSENNGVAGVRCSRTICDLSVRGEKEKKDKLDGGKGDKIPYDKLNKKQLEMGTKVEMEHTDNKDTAKEIAGDHLAEELEEGKDKDEQEYYTKLKTIHEDRCKDVIPGVVNDKG